MPASASAETHVCTVMLEGGLGSGPATMPLPKSLNEKLAFCADLRRATRENGYGYVKPSKPLSTATPHPNK